LLYLAWKHGGHDPYRLFHGLRDDYSPWEGGTPMPPSHPGRIRQLIYGFARLAEEETARLAGAKTATRAMS